MTFFRLYRILKTFKAYRIKSLLPNHPAARKFFWVTHLLFWVRPKAKKKSAAERLALCLQELGPIWIKFGQMLSTRRELLPHNVADALSQLHDHVAPFDGNKAKKIIETALSKHIDHYFDDFDPIPLASASVAQVHSAKLRGSQMPIIIKVIRPKIDHVIRDDIKLMYWLARKIEHSFSQAKRLHLHDIVKDYELTIFNELNLIKESENTKQLRHNFLNSDMLYVPYIYPEFTRENMLVEERVFGVPITEITQQKYQQVNLKLLAERGVTVFFKQVFDDNFFHADMHPGNIFIDISNPNDPKYIGIDCAIIGQLSKEDQRFLAKTFIAFFNQDYASIAQSYIEHGWVNPTTNRTLLKVALKNVCEPIFNKPLEQISFAQILMNLFSVAHEFEMEVQPQLVLLQKTLFYIEGLGRQLYPQLDLWQTAKPFIEEWYKKQRSPKIVMEKLSHVLPHWQSLIFDLPEQINVQKQTNQQLQKEIENLSKQLIVVKKNVRNVFYLTLFFLIITIISLLLHC